ncbi:unnamed protein product, partial [Closterium sp. NIES-54]
TLRSLELLVLAALALVALEQEELELEALAQEVLELEASAPGWSWASCGGRGPFGECVEVGTEPGGTESGGAEPGGAEPGGPESGGAEPEGAGSLGAEPGGTASEGAPPGGALSRREPLSPLELREWFARRWRRAAGAGGSSAAEGAAATGPGGASPGSPGAAGPEGSSGAGTAESAGAETTTASPTGGAAGGAAGGATGGPAGAGSPTWGTGAVPAVPGVATRPQPSFVPLLQQVLGPPPPPPFERPLPVQSQLQPASPLPAPSVGATLRFAFGLLSVCVHACVHEMVVGHEMI